MDCFGEVLSELEGFTKKNKNGIYAQANNYFLIFMFTRIIFEKFRFKEKDISCSLLKKVKRIAEFLEFSLQEENLNTGRHQKLGLILGCLEVYKENGVVYKRIYLESNEKISEFQEKYAIAYLIGCYYFQKKLPEEFVAECAEVRIPCMTWEFNAAIFTSFMLLPPDIFLENIHTYISKEEKPIYEDTMLFEISQWEQIPYSYVIKSYELIKVMIGLFRNDDWMVQIENIFETEKAEALRGWFYSTRDVLQKVIPDELYY